MNNVPRDANRVAILKQVSQQSSKLSKVLREHEQSQTILQKRIRLANSAVGAFGIIFGFLSYTPSIKSAVGENFPIVIAALGAIFLLLDAYSPHLLDDPNPERFRDYAFYIRKFARDIETHLTNTDLSEVQWNATADLLSDWARTNIDDVALKFGKVFRKSEP
jgi:hypothetical protein